MLMAIVAAWAWAGSQGTATLSEQLSDAADSQHAEQGLA